MENTEILKVINCEMVSSNKREKVSGGLYITFYSKENVNKGDYFDLNHTGIHHFKVSDIKIANDNILEVRAVEAGYWASKYDNKKDFDLRSLIGSSVSPVTNQESISTIRTKSCWC